MKRKCKQFDTSFKLEIVHMIKKQGLSIFHVSESMSIGQSTIRRRVTQYESEQSENSGIGNPLTAEQQLIR
ncbi:transposase [Nitrosomonas eutropha]|uniref:transposase n=1 Tax=Nitrosomonas TaxID=914 RepID=UPI00088F443C|nr:MULTISPECIES: transposase [Nitrosomonas]MXS81463.1 hypothetical protein [Nitrosomonas sp. GH22]SCX30028.1 transposase [Nitrosomonas eutropha]SDX19634.1 transposase [Nitrosomonas eutropha]